MRYYGIIFFVSQYACVMKTSNKAILSLNITHGTCATSNTPCSVGVFNVKEDPCLFFRKILNQTQIYNE